MVNFLPKKRRLVPSKILQQFNARLVNVRKDQLLFETGDRATDFFQVEEGQVKMYAISPDGKEFVQGIFNPGESFGEPPLMGDFPYPSSAVAVSKGKVWRLPRPEFFQLLKENFDLHLKLDKVLCSRLQYKSMLLKEISMHNPDHRILTLLRYFKKKLVKANADKVLIPYTRQQIADMTGLRVETVIRTVKKMEGEGKLALEGHRIKF